MKEESGKDSRIRLGWIIFIALAVLTVVEFLMGAYLQPATPYLAAIAIVKAWLIVYHFMHIAQLWRREGERE